MGLYQINSIQHAIQFFGVTQREVAQQTNPRISQSVISRCANTPTHELDYEVAVTVTAAIAKAYAIKYPDPDIFGTLKFTVTTRPEGTHIMSEY